MCEAEGRREELQAKYAAICANPLYKMTRPFYLVKRGCGKIVRKTKKGRRFFGCEAGPDDCDFMSWQKPIAEKCPQCGGYMVEKGNKAVCADEKCGYMHEIKKQEEGA